jgi:hypothetical protein
LTNVSKDIGFYLDKLFFPRLGYQVLATIVKNRKKIQHLLNWPTSIGDLRFMAGTFFEHM